MKQRIDYRAIAPEATRGFRQAGADARASGLEPGLIQLIDVLASQLNGCAYCLDMHVREAKELGETDERLHLVGVWREADCFTERERAAFAWTEAVTKLAETGVPDDVYEAARKQFSELELTYLTVAIAAINAHNRINVAFRTPVGSKGPAPVSR
jgi:AhpD family alkylhydroperoxidase